MPEDFQAYRTKPDIAIEEIDRVPAAGVRFGCVLADTGYGLSAPFRQALSARGLRWAVGIPRHQKVYPADVQLIFAVAGRGRPRVRHVPDVKSRAAHAMLEEVKWRKISWRRGTKGRLTARFAAMRVRIADGAPQRIGAAGAQDRPGEEAWLVGEHRSNDQRKYYLSNLFRRHRDRRRRRRHQGALDLRTGAAATQGGTRPRPLRRALLDGAASPRSHDNDGLCLRANTKARAGGPEKRVSGPPPQPSMTAIRQAIIDRISRPPPRQCPPCGGSLSATHFTLLPK